ncbi:MAG: phosphate/phosphite/phosphonate ABC transporter substrate-binding protein [bacterium]
MYRRIITLILIFSLGLTVLGCGSEDVPADRFSFDEPGPAKEKVIIGRVPSETIIQLLREIEPLIKIIEQQADVDVQFKFATNYAEIISGMNEGCYDLAFLGPLAYIDYTRNTKKINYEPILKPVRYGNSYYRSIIFTYKNSGIKNISDLKGKRIAFVDETSASGYLFPTATLLKEGINPHQDMEKVDFLYRHNLVVNAVYEKKYEAGAVYKDARPAALETDEDPDTALPVIAETDRIPSEPTVIKNSFARNNPQLAKKITTIMLNLEETTDGQRILKELGIDRYVEAGKEDYLPLSEIIAVLENL